MSKPTKPLPKFSSESQERAHWESHDSSVHIDWTKAKKVNLPNLKPTIKTILVPMPQPKVDAINTEAISRDVQ